MTLDYKNDIFKFFLISEDFLNTICIGMNLFRMHKTVNFLRDSQTVSKSKEIVICQKYVHDNQREDMVSAGNILFL